MKLQNSVNCLLVGNQNIHLLILNDVTLISCVRAREHAKQYVSRPTSFVSFSVRPPFLFSPERERGLEFEKVKR